MTTNEQHRFIRGFLYASPNQQATISEIHAKIPWRHSYYTKQNLGVILATMVKSRQIVRIKKGLYGLPSPPSGGLFG